MSDHQYSLYLFHRVFFYKVRAFLQFQILGCRHPFWKDVVHLWQMMVSVALLPLSQRGVSFSLLEPQDQENLEPIKKRKEMGEPNLNMQLFVTYQCRNTQTLCSCEARCDGDAHVHHLSGVAARLWDCSPGVLLVFGCRITGNTMLGCHWGLCFFWEPTYQYWRNVHASQLSVA